MTHAGGMKMEKTTVDSVICMQPDLKKEKVIRKLFARSPKMPIFLDQTLSDITHMSNRSQC